MLYSHNHCWADAEHSVRLTGSHVGHRHEYLIQKVTHYKNNSELPLSDIHPIHCTNWSQFLPCTSVSIPFFFILNQKASGLYWMEMGTTFKHWVILPEQSFVNLCTHTHTHMHTHKHTLTSNTVYVNWNCISVLCVALTFLPLTPLLSPTLWQHSAYRP